MKNNKAFTLVELLIVIVIIGIVLTTVAAFGNIFKLLFWALVYFAIPASIFGVALKLNQKHKWLVKKRFSSNFFKYRLKNGDDIDKEIVQINVWAFIIAWPIYLPVMLAIIGGMEMYHRYLKHWFNIPEGK
jgi:prepilin-type N-terminal cleavage/methylation domain-containing protein